MNKDNIAYKHKFFQHPSGLGLTVALSVIVAAVTIGVIVMTITFPRLWWLLIEDGLVILLTVMGWRHFSYQVYVYEDKLVVKGIFGVLTECKIADIEKVYKKAFYKEGEFIILKDNRKIKNPNSFRRKNCYVRFECTDKSMKALMDFWHGSMEVLGYKDFLPNNEA